MFIENRIKKRNETDSCNERRFFNLDQKVFPKKWETKNYNGTARVKTQVVTNSNSGIKENGLLIAQPKEQLFAKLKQLERSLRELS